MATTAKGFLCFQTRCCFCPTGRALQEEGDPLAMDPLDLIDDEQGEDDVDEVAQLEEEDNSMFDIGTGMSRSDVKKVGACQRNRELHTAACPIVGLRRPHPLHRITQKHVQCDYLRSTLRPKGAAPPPLACACMKLSHMMCMCIIV